MSNSTSNHAYQGNCRMFVRGEYRPRQRVSQSKLVRRLGWHTVPSVEAIRRLESEAFFVSPAASVGDIEADYFSTKSFSLRLTHTGGLAP